MKEQDEFEQQIADVYQQRKSQNKAPKHIKQALFEEKNSQSLRFGLKSYTKNSALIGAIALALFVIFMQGTNTFNFPFEQKTGVDNLIVEVHAFADEEIKLQNANRVIYDLMQEQLLERQEANLIAHSSAMRVIEVKDGIALVDCNEQVIKLSNSLLASLYAASALNTTNKSLNEPAHETLAQIGDLLLLDFANNGQIVGLKEAKNEEFCPQLAE